MRYQLWTVFENGLAVRYYIINRETKKVQSTWKTFKEASQTIETLNKAFVKKAV